MTIKYQNKCILNVKKADNLMNVYLNADSGEANGTLFGYSTNGLGAAPPNATVDLVPALQGIGGSGKLSIIGANFSGGGSMEVEIITDSTSHQVVNENLGAFTSKMWSVDIQKN
ncbi:hypothetical protein [Okeania sp. SIO2B3]|uniref:hypothetical protein n=1 Tax=Okeania sp. SIO2B3 TaxID=2607784 RepID=UPI0013C22ED1|nr:hypothetical protein [Okeania sp. SIO2B3]NET42489.1 hypothetical protein [Okeania sp. SIO2B3]